MIYPKYEVYTQRKHTIPILKSDVLPICTFELGKPVRTLFGINGFLTWVSGDGLSGVVDIGVSQIYRVDELYNTIGVDTEFFLFNAPVFMNATTGQITTISTNAYVFGRVWFDVGEYDYYPASVPEPVLNVSVILLN